jgi:hypothetical protein
MFNFEQKRGHVDFEMKLGWTPKKNTYNFVLKTWNIQKQ